MVNSLVFILLISPWLNPFATGPSLTASPLLFSWTCTLLFLGVSICVNNRFDHARLTRTAAGAWLVAGLLSSVMAVLQYFNFTAGLEPWISGARPGEAYANLRQRNHFASLTNIALAALVWLMSTLVVDKVDQSRATKNVAFAMFGWPWVLLASALATLLTVGNALASSRTGLIQFIFIMLCGILFGSYRRPILRWIYVSAIISYTLMSLVLAVFASSWSGVLGRFQEVSDPCLGRLTLWSNTIELIKQKPWFGWGLGELDYAHYIHSYSEPRFCGVMDNAHNLPLHLAAELGIPAVLIISLLIGWLIFQRNPLVEKNVSRQLAWTIFGVIGLHSLFEYPLWYGPFQMSVLLCCIIMHKKYLESNRLWSFGSGLNIRVFVGVLFCVCLSGLVFSIREYSRVSQLFLPPSQRDEAFREDTLLKVYPVFIFGSQLRFAQLTMHPLTPANANWVFYTSQELLHYSPEPTVIELLIQSAAALGNRKEMDLNLTRYRLAFPDAYAAWAKVHVKKQSE
jgi:hypothetical protein